MTIHLQSQKKRILVVDDQVSDTLLVKRFLEDTNEYEVKELNDASAALSAAEHFQPHLILLDVMMPDINGGELAARFRENPNLKTVPIVFLTARVTKEEVDLCGGRIGQYPVLAKPIVQTELVWCVKQHLTTLAIQR
jgi:CheY-like chemotaxis protein